MCLAFIGRTVLDSEMELAPRLPSEIPCQFNHKGVEKSVQKGTALQVALVQIQAEREFSLAPLA
jgi:hypothetical protein